MLVTQMFLIKSNFVFLISVIICVVNSKREIRRIQGGEELKTDKSYVVYLVRAAISPRLYDTWLCGGALVNSEFIVTSAACVDDVEFLYAIAGYRKYVIDDEIDIDPCTRRMKKKVIYTCTPLSYELDYGDLAKWAYIDIALAKVESPYDFKDVTFKQICSYIPTTIPINYENKYQEAGIDAMVFGWGHERIWRQPDDTKNYNQQYLHYAACLIDEKEQCKSKFESYPEMHKVIDKHMICTIGDGNINEVGDTIVETDSLADGCSGQQELRGLCTYVKPFVTDETRKVMNSSEPDSLNRTNSTAKVINTTISTTISHTTDINKTGNFNNTQYGNISDTYYKTKNASRRNGFCQNDHGGPLVAWVGSHEVLIGVASVFKVSVDRECTGPYLYTSTQCNGAFLDCVLTGGEGLHGSRRSYNICDTPPPERGYDTVEKYISWKNHPAGPADNERYNTMNLKYEKYNYPEGYIKMQDPRSDINKEPIIENVKYVVQDTGANNGAMAPGYIMNSGTMLQKERYRAPEAISNIGPIIETQNYKGSEAMLNSPMAVNGPIINSPINNSPISVNSAIVSSPIVIENGLMVPGSNINTPTFAEQQRYRAQDNYEVGYKSQYRGSGIEAKYEPNEYAMRPVYSNSHGVYDSNLPPLENAYGHRESNSHGVYASNLAPLENIYGHRESNSHGLYASNLAPLESVYAHRESYQPIEKYAVRVGDRPLAPSGIYISNAGQELAHKDKHPTFEMYAAKYKYGHTEELKRLGQETVLLRPQRPF